MPLTRTKIFKMLGTKPTNPRWSWCALSPDRKRAVFTLWKDGMKNGRYLLLRYNSPFNARRGWIDQKRILEICLKENIPSFGLICVAKDTNAETRSIKSIESEYLIKLKLEHNNDEIWGTLTRKIHLLELANTIRSETQSKGNALMDTGNVPEGHATPDRAMNSSYSFARDPKVRNYVISRANGRCEYCRKDGFLMPDGKRYLETHHIIALARQGKDTVENVIALCPEHHREAHYGVNAETLENDFINCLERKKTTHNI